MSVRWKPERKWWRKGPGQHDGFGLPLRVRLSRLPVLWAEAERARALEAEAASNVTRAAEDRGAFCSACGSLLHLMDVKSAYFSYLSENITCIFWPVLREFSSFLHSLTS